MNLTGEFLFSIVINLIAIGIIFGTYKTTIEFMQTQIREMKEQSEKDKEELKEYFLAKNEDIKNHFEEHLNRVEEKQDKHNNLVERMVIVEQSAKSAHHRIDTIENKEIRK